MNPCLNASSECKQRHSATNSRRLTQQPQSQPGELQSRIRSQNPLSDLPSDLRQVDETIDHCLAFNLASGVMRKDLLTYREIKKTENSVTAEITIAHLELRN